MYGENFTSIMQVYESSECAQYDANHCQKISLIFFDQISVITGKIMGLRLVVL